MFLVTTLTGGCASLDTVIIPGRGTLQTRAKNKKRKQKISSLLGTILRLAISRLLRLGFAGKRDDIRRTYGVKAWTARQMIDFAAHIPLYGALTCRRSWYLSGSSIWQMTGALREDIRETIPRQHDAAFGKRFDRRNIVCGEDVSVLLILTALQLPVAVGVLFRQAEALLSGPSLKTGFRQFREPRSGMGRLEPQRCGGIAHALEPLRPKNEIIPERMETDRAASFTDPDIEAGATAVAL